MGFYLTNLGKDRFVLGYPFLWNFNPRTDWKTRRLLEGEVEIETMRFEDAQRLVTKVQQQARRTRAHFVRKTTFSQQRKGSRDRGR